MIGNILTLFIFVVMSDCTVDNQGILLEISSGDNVCNNNKLFKNYQFSETPEFAAMCNIPVPNETQVEFLIENNVVPILCMGFYDVSVRLCNEAVNYTNYFEDVFPPSPKQFTGIFNRLKQSEEYSDLNKFCSETIKKSNNFEAASNNTKFWWDLLSNKLNSKESCRSICRTNDFNLVQPLCSYIVWSNDLVHNHRKSLEESEAKESGVPVHNLTDKNIVQPDLTKKVLGDQVPPETSDGEYVKPLTNQFKTTDAVSEGHVFENPVSQGYINPRPTELETSNSGINSNKQSIEVYQDQHNSSTIVNETKEITAPAIESAKPAVNSSSNTSNNGLIKRPDNTESNLATKVEEKQHQKDTSNVPKEEVSAGGTAPVDTKTDVKSKDQSKQIEIPEDTNQNDVNLNFDLDSGVPSDQPTGNDPEIQEQLEEEQEDDDEDEATVGENPEKAGSKMNQKNFNKPHTDQGKPDEVYSEVDHTVLLEDPFIETEDTHFFSYFLFMSLLTIVAYLAFHNKNKLLALAVEGRRTKSSRRRPNSSNYSKLDCNLEEAMVSKTTASVTHVLY